MITNGAMRPGYILGVTGCLIFGGTLFARIADGHSERPADSTPLIARSADAVIHLPGFYKIGEAEGDALRQIARSLDEQPDTPVIVQWTEVYRDARIASRATYLPHDQILRCERVGQNHYDYNPVRPDAIRAALRNSDDNALFANANLYSMPRAAADGR